MTLSQEKLSLAAEQLEDSSPREVLQWAVDVYGEDLALSVSFGGSEGIVLLDMLSRTEGGEKVQVFTLDTGFLFEETVRFREETMSRYPMLDLEIIEPDLTVEEQVERYGDELWSCSPDICCQIRKVEPQQRFLRGYDAWMTGIRRTQTQDRSDTPIVDWDEFFGVAKVSPLANWSKEQVEEYVEERELPLNPLLSQGYRSIGCWPCTRPVEDGEDERAGRWMGSDKTECGLHIANGRVERANS